MSLREENRQMSMLIPNLEELVPEDHIYRKKNNMKGKNRDKDRWLSSVRMPYEGVFSCMSSKARYRGVVKTQFQAFMQAMAFNLKRLVKIQAPPIILNQC
jgi:IS5 family transposase